MNKGHMVRRIKSLEQQIEREKQYLLILTIDEIVKNNEIDKINPCYNTLKKNNLRYYAGEINGTTKLNPRFKFPICREDELSELSEQELDKLKSFKLKHFWKRWIKKHSPDFNDPRKFQENYMKQMEHNFHKDCFIFIDL